MSSTSFDGLGYSAYGIGPLPQSRSRLEALLKANNSQYSVLFNSGKFHNHLPHHLIAAYFLGATSEQLTDIFEADAEPPPPSLGLDPWKENKGDALTDSDWKTHLGDKAYDRRFFEYFSDKVQVENRGDWHDKVRTFLVEDGLTKGLQGGLYHPLIHLANALEMDNEYVALEALTLASTEFFEIKVSGNGEKVPKADVLEVFAEFVADPAVIATQKDTYEQTLRNPILTDYYAHRLDFSDKRKTLMGMLELGTLMLAASVDENGRPIYDFFLVHVLTSSHSLAEVVFSKNIVLPEKTLTRVIQDLWLGWLSLISRAALSELPRERITSYPIESVEDAWKRSIDLTLNGPKKFDPHLVKAIRALLFAESFTGDRTGFYAKAALRLVQEIDKFHYFPFRMSI